MSAVPLRLQVMGPLRVWRDGAEVDAGPRQQRALLALLLARDGAPVGMSDLIALVWGPGAPPSAVNVVHKYVGTLRRLLEPDLPVRVPGAYLHSGTSGYRLTAGPDVLDLAEFRAGVAAARAAEQPEQALKHYAEALPLCHGLSGDALADSVGASATFAAVDSEFYDAVVAASDLAVRLRRPAPVLAPLRLAAEMNPLHEPVHAGLITALAMAGQQAEALAVYRTIRARLADDLGIDPGQSLADAHRRVLTQDVPRPAVDARPPLTPAQLPPDLPVFVGRAPELAALGDLVEGMADRSAPLIVALDGMGGVGKSTLATHFAHRYADRFPDGQLYLDLQADRGDDDVRAGDALRSLLYGLGVPAAQVPDTFDARVGAYRSRTAGRRIVVFLDNVRDPAQVRPLLPSSPESLVLLTSRRPLLGLAAFDGAHLLRLDLPDRSTAEQLLERRLTGRTADTAVVDEIIESCGRLPLALAILAARLTARPALSLEAVAADLRDGARRLQVLAAGDGVATRVPLSPGRTGSSATTRPGCSGCCRWPSPPGSPPGPWPRWPAATRRTPGPASTSSPRRRSWRSTAGAGSRHMCWSRRTRKSFSAVSKRTASAGPRWAGCSVTTCTAASTRR
ncbi:BTAD domain-containing putative transcriptional regulator [Actinoplanes sp. HUAS TT8]|uniref:AfsR/SARP family transcriptional regulator n=1 Tax=Actinoplanes sp. HUAS TT8 TaxID=3447453 RepID=UPI003F524590